jgi:hypothetical protein
MIQAPGLGSRCSSVVKQEQNKQKYSKDLGFDPKPGLNIFVPDLFYEEGWQQSGLSL